jgi:hypothetical protein
MCREAGIWRSGNTAPEDLFQEPSERRRQTNGIRAGQRQYSVTHVRSGESSDVLGEVEPQISMDLGNQDILRAPRFTAKPHSECPPDVMRFGVWVETGPDTRIQNAFQLRTHPLSFLSQRRVGRICDTASCQATYYS